MGKVFSPDAIAAMEYPEPGAHQEAAHTIIEFLESSAGAKQRCGAVFGSVALGTENMRSDVDVLIGCNGDDEGLTGSRAVVIVNDVQRRLKVPVGICIINDEDIAHRSHPITRDPLFAEHLVQVLRNGTYTFGKTEGYMESLVTFGSAEEQLASATSITRQYIAAKRTRFLTALANYGDEPDYMSMQRAFEFPAALGRKLLRLAAIREWATAHDTPSPLPMDMESRKRWLTDGVLALTRETDYHASAQWLAVSDQEYTFALSDVVNGGYPLSKYENWLTKIYSPALNHAYNLAVGASKLT